jgi:uncharacterized protein (UPF0335 family)
MSEDTTTTAPAGNSQITSTVLKGYVNRIENLEDQKKEIGTDIKDVYNEAANEGFDKKALREVIRRRRKTRAEIEDLENMVDVYESAL